uniref:DUF1985 domain-containing protein n=1 Tax=Brassica campestris TaxID=3711 RepID=A0A3P6AIV3_BRACM|nr:unnamed protein product [Brassica rapa]
MLLLIESILLQKKSLLDGGTTFTLDYVKIIRDMDVLMTYPWERTAYNLLLKSLQRLKVTCILPPISNDPEADVCMEDEANKDLDDMADLSKRGYKFKIRDWLKHVSRPIRC